MWVKICANTNLEDALTAAELGADAVGFVFAASKRQVTAAQVAAITAHLPATVERVGVFDTRDADEIGRTASEAGLTTVQLHGGFDESLLEKLARRFGNFRVIQTLHWKLDAAPGEPSAATLASDLKRIAAIGTVDRILIDSKIGKSGGGTGVAYDWSAVRRVLSEAPAGIKIIAAGGLSPANVAEAIAVIGPWGVDVATGVEALPGRKDPVLVARFIAQARG